MLIKTNSTNVNVNTKQNLNFKSKAMKDCPSTSYITKKGAKIKSGILSKVFSNFDFWKLKSLSFLKATSFNDNAIGQNMDIYKFKESQKSSDKSKILLWAAGMATIVTAAVKNKLTPEVSFVDMHINEKTNQYRELIAKGLKNKFGIDIKSRNLKSILGIEEFRDLIKKYSPSDFSLGNPRSEDPKDFFKNVTECKFRISLHSHSVFSDGRLTPQEFIDMSVKYADKVARKLPKEDAKPPFVIALTDHDNFEGCQEIIKIIAQSPKKYKNLKFVSGAELSVKDGHNHFDLTALCVNPFDENLTKYVNDLKNSRANSAREFIWRINLDTGTNLNIEEIEKNGSKEKKTLQNRSGVVYSYDMLNAILNQVNDKHHDHIKHLFNTNNYSDRNTPSMDVIIDVVKKASGESSLTHPARSFPNCNLNWYQEFLQHLKNKGVIGIEANHQYTFDHHKKIGNLEQINSVSREFAKNNDMFVSGGTDSHEYDIFGHHHKISNELLKSFLE